MSTFSTDEDEPDRQYSLGAIKAAIVSMLEGRPNRSCVRQDLTRLTLKHLRLPLRGKARGNFERKAKLSVTHLAHAKIIELYRATNERVRLTPGYQQRFQRLQQAIPPQRDPSQDGSPVDRSIALLQSREEYFDIDDFPNLPELPDDGATPSDIAEDPIGPNPLRNDSWNELRSNSESPISIGAAAGPATLSPLTLERLVNKIKQEPGFAVELVLGLARIDYFGPSTTLSGEIVATASGFMVGVFIPFRQEAAVPLLELLSQDYRISALRILNRLSQRVFMLRCILHSEDVERARLEILQVFREASEASRLLLQY